MIAEDVPPYLDGFEKMLKERKSESDYLVGKEVKKVFFFHFLNRLASLVSLVDINFFLNVYKIR